MARTLMPQRPQRPARLTEQPVPPIPVVDESDSGVASVQLSKHRTRLSSHRTALSEHRTSLSEHRTDLSMYRTDLSGERTEMSMRRTGMSFQRTRMSAERTLMSVIRTSLSLISFGFTIYQVFRKMADHQLLTGSESARHFGVSLVALGIAMLVIGIVYHLMFMSGLRQTRNEMTADGLIYGQSGYPPSMTLIAAVLLLVIGLMAIVNMVFHVSVFG
ncbi:MAG TPA: DUF202 domain-containing protein [Burkholderiaceae bacterium]|nr:DUF202 domain-containing protein [Burkholderiaceae bacterium]